MAKTQKNHRSGRTAHRSLAVAVAFVFLLAQMYGAAHAAEFGPDVHEHGGVPCAVQFLSEPAKGLSAPATVSVEAPPLPDAVKRSRTVAFRQPKSIANRHRIRGPPLLLP